jgi:hypothetical protein
MHRRRLFFPSSSARSTWRTRCDGSGQVASWVPTQPAQTRSAREPARALDAEAQQTAADRRGGGRGADGADGAARAAHGRRPALPGRRGVPAHPRDLRAHNCIVSSGRSPWSFQIDGQVMPVAAQGNLRVNQAAVASSIRRRGCCRHARGSSWAPCCGTSRPSKAPGRRTPHVTAARGARAGRLAQGAAGAQQGSALRQRSPHPLAAAPEPGPARALDRQPARRRKR